MTCQARKPTILERIKIAFGDLPDLHDWRYFLRQHEHTIYHCRDCVCGASQLKLIGPTGDNSWRDLNTPWKWQWEREKFLQSTEVQETP